MSWRGEGAREHAVGATGSTALASCGYVDDAAVGERGLQRHGGRRHDHLDAVLPLESLLHHLLIRG